MPCDPYTTLTALTAIPRSFTILEDVGTRFGEILMCRVIRIRIGFTFPLPILVILLWDNPAILVIESALTRATLDDN